MIMTIAKLTRLILSGVLVTSLVGASFAIFAESDASNQGDQGVFVSQGSNDSTQATNAPSDQNDQAQAIGQTQDDNNAINSDDKVTDNDQN